jgi:hypothetical protein
LASGKAGAASSVRRSGEASALTAWAAVANLSFVEVSGLARACNTSRQRPGDSCLGGHAFEDAGPYLLDHPQRFLRDSPDNAAALQAWRERLAR